MFGLHWIQAALDELTTFWLAADSPTRSAITAVVHSLEQELIANPNNVGESREEGERVAIVYPMGVTFEIDDDKRTVHVLHVWDMRRKK